MSAVWWWALVGAVWTVAAIWVGMGVGRTVRLREDRDDYDPKVTDESDMDVSLSMIRESPVKPYRYRGEQR